MTKIQWVDLIARIVPLIAPAFPHGDKIAEMAPRIINGIHEAEDMRGASGPKKLEHVQNIVADGVAVTNTAAGKQVLDPTGTLVASQAVINASIAVAKEVEKAHDVLNPPHETSEPAAPAVAPAVVPPPLTNVPPLQG